MVVTVPKLPNRATPKPALEKISSERLAYKLCWRHVRRTMSDPAEMAWRLKRVTWADDPTSRALWNLCCDIAYTRAMSGHYKNRLGRVIA